MEIGYERYFDKFKRFTLSEVARMNEKSLVALDVDMKRHRIDILEAIGKLRSAILLKKQQMQAAQQQQQVQQRQAAQAPKTGPQSSASSSSSVPVSLSASDPGSAAVVHAHPAPHEPATPVADPFGEFGSSPSLRGLDEELIKS